MVAPIGLSLSSSRLFLLFELVPSSDDKDTMVELGFEKNGVKAELLACSGGGWGQLRGLSGITLWYTACPLLHELWQFP